MKTDLSKIPYYDENYRWHEEMDYLKKAFLSVRDEKFSKIEALWILTETPDGRPRLLLKAGLPDGTAERVFLNGEIIDILLDVGCYCDVIYDYEGDLVNPNSFFIEPIDKEIVNGHILTVYDRDREK